MFDYVIKYKWAFIGTFFLHVGMAIYMNQVHVERHLPPLGRLEQFPIVLEEDVKIAELDPTVQPPVNANEKIANETVNERDKIGESDKKYDARNFKNLDSDVEKDIRDYEKSAFDDFAAKHQHTVEVNDDAKDKKVDKKKNDGNNGDETSKVRKAGRVDGSYDFAGRAHEVFAKPAYVCKGSGMIVLKVKLNASGKVVSAEIDKANSNYSEECMGENALKYTRKCKFEASTKYGDPQAGTITYTFVAQ
ncbi:MAG TPA: energy transducer TonB [Flavobacteriales bacterium]|nr:energy transducer TonB [Flavobacteriales bacterium]